MFCRSQHCRAGFTETTDADGGGGGGGGGSEGRPFPSIHLILLCCRCAFGLDSIFDHQLAMYSYTKLYTRGSLAR